REEMVLDLEVEPAHEPREERAPGSEVHTGLELMDRPLLLESISVRRRRSKLRRVVAVCELKYGSQASAEGERRDEMKDDDLPDRMEEGGDDQRPPDEERLPSDESDERPAARRRKGVLP